jgi:Flp pilus assembly protein TadB
MSDRFQTAWALITGVLCLLVMVGLAFTGPLALAGVAAVLVVSFALRWMVQTVAGRRGNQRCAGSLTGRRRR